MIGNNGSTQDQLETKTTIDNYRNKKASKIFSLLPEKLVQENCAKIKKKHLFSNFLLHKRNYFCKI